MNSLSVSFCLIDTNTETPMSLRQHYTGQVYWDLQEMIDYIGDTN